MTQPKILVTGATGKTGGVVVRELLAAGFPVRAMVRKDDARAQALRRQGVEVAVADMADPEAVAAALKGVQRAYYLPPYEAAALYMATVFATAAKDARLEHTVLMTQWLASPTHPALSTRQHWLTDRLFAMIPQAGLTIVNPGFFADMPYLTVMPYAAHLGIYPWMFGEGRNAPPSVDDIGRVAAAALMDPTRHAGQTYRPTGPALLGREEIIGTLSRVLGRRVRAVPMPLWMFHRAATLDGLPIQLLSVLEHYFEEARRGTFEAGAPTDHVRQVTGRMPETFEAVARRHAQLPENQRSTAGFVKQLAKFMAVPLVPAPRIKAYLAGLHMPVPEHPTLAADSTTWRAEHAAVLASNTARPSGVPVADSKMLHGE
jgi:NAD(P)H dehydrogenase (quinone)